MLKNKNEISVPDELVMNKIYFIRNQKVMLDRDLAELYEVETKQLKRQVIRNGDRFPEDFMFELNKEEFENLRRQFVTLKILHIDLPIREIERVRNSIRNKWVTNVTE